MSFIYRRNRCKPKTDSWGTPHKDFSGSDKVLFKFTVNFLFDRYDLNQQIASLEIP